MKMNYFVVGTNDMPASKAFYDALFEGEGLHSMAPSDRMTYWLGEDFAFAVARPFDERPATIGNGSMVGFCVGGKEDVERMHRRALELGGTCEGAPGQRGPKFSAYVRDLDGNKLCLSD
ncbi:MAG: VOC family protein [Sulfitobacter sp.]|uniref:VOC family protein n=1 Tax=Alphaproteobacteria TaxID=28211 RepID=UPI001ADB8DB8|nr:MULTISPECIES: VOC family protein [unclassified Sulfitobacter]MBO9432421.1 VOC family protein [Sulfitobacter sp. R18_1]WOI15257.1 VOC family protein [Sulfitobacter sp. LC.270.F.C4]